MNTIMNPLRALKCEYRQVSNIRCTLVDNKIVDHADVVGASPVGAAPTTSSFSTWHLASLDWAKTTARQYEKHSSLGIWCHLYLRFYGIFVRICTKTHSVTQKLDCTYFFSSVPLHLLCSYWVFPCIQLRLEINRIILLIDEIWIRTYKDEAYWSFPLLDPLFKPTCMDR